jgi:hypothetical protein
MEFNKIRIVLIFMFLLTFTHYSYCQPVAAKEVILNSYDINDDSLKSYLKGNSIFIIITNKSCISCFNETCNYISKKYDSSYKVYGLIFMPKNYLALIPAQQHYKEQIRCVTNFYFYFVKEQQKQEISTISESPSPQLIIHTDNSYKYIPYGEVLRLAEEK